MPSRAVRHGVDRDGLPVVMIGSGSDSDCELLLEAVRRGAAVAVGVRGCTDTIKAVDDVGLLAGSLDRERVVIAAGPWMIAPDRAGWRADVDRVDPDDLAALLDRPDAALVRLDHGGEL